MEKKYECLVYNLGVSGDTSESLMKRLRMELKARVKGHYPLCILIFQIGINDSQIFIRTNKPRVPLEKFSENLNKMIDISQKYSDEFFFLGLTPVDEERVNPIPWNKELGYVNRNIRMFEGEIGKICRERKVSFVPLFRKLKNRRWIKNLVDGVHPNSYGHELIFKTVLNALKKKLGI